MLKIVSRLLIFCFASIAIKWWSIKPDTAYEDIPVNQPVFMVKVGVMLFVHCQSYSVEQGYEVVESPA